MKRASLILTIAAVVAFSCANSNTRNVEAEKGRLLPEVSGTEAEVYQVSETAGETAVVSESLSAGSGVTGNEIIGEAGVSPGQDEIKGGTKLLTKAEFLKTVWDYEKNPREWVFLGNKPAIIDFYADWCGPCRIASPILEEISHEFAGKIDVFKIDTQKEQELAVVFGVRSIPAFLYIPKTGKPTMIPGIARTPEDTKQMFRNYINQILLQNK